MLFCQVVYSILFVDVLDFFGVQIWFVSELPVVNFLNAPAQYWLYSAVEI